MRRSLLLVLLASWAHLGTGGELCDTGVVITGHVVSVRGSRVAGAEVVFLQTYNSSSRLSCLEECCAGKYGLCSVASFKNHNEELNCQHFSCRPLHKCKYISFNGTDSFTFPASGSAASVIVGTNREILNKHKDQSTLVSKILSELKDHPRAISARKGVGSDPPKLGKLDGKDFINAIEDQFALKNDNTTIKPRKGVDIISYTYPLDSSNSSSVIKPRKGVIMEDLRDFNATKSKVKPRKGVEPFLPGIQPISSVEEYSILYETTSLPHTSRASSKTVQLKTATSSDGGDMLTMLQQVFEDDPNITDSDIKLSDMSRDPSTITTSQIVIQSTVINPTSVSVSSIQTLVPINPMYISSDTFSVSTVPVDTLMSSDRLEPSSAFAQVQASHYSGYAFKSTPSLLNSVAGRSTTASTTESSLISSKLSTKQLISASRPNVPLPSMTSTAVTTKPTVSFDYEVLLNSSFLNDDLSLDSKSAEISEETENNRRYKSSMHLVLSLVFGLVVLFVVFGAVAKRVYDVWMRRHYHRMDFLIDGMYDGYS